MQLLNHFIILICLILVVLCMAAPLRKSGFCRRRPFLQKLLRPHAAYAVLLLVLSLVHGILSGKAAAMFSGKLAWTALLLLILLAIPRSKIPSPLWRRIHFVFSYLVCILIGVHILHAVFF